VRDRFGAVLVGFALLACGKSEKNGGHAAVSGGSSTESLGGTSNTLATSAGGSTSASASTSVTSATTSSVQSVSVGGSTGDVTGSGGSTGEVTGSGGSAGEGDVDTTPRPCNTGESGGCDAGEICLDTATDACVPSIHQACPGYCGATRPKTDCELVQCAGSVTCPALPPECPEGQVSSIVDECWGPCVPNDCCACSQDGECRNGDFVCDLSAGRCVEPAAPEPRCFLPFDSAPCDGAQLLVAFIDGHCQERTDGTCGDDSHFFTLEECMRRCEGLPQQGECPEGRVARKTCLACGAGGGCSTSYTVCANACSTDEDCDSYMTCLDGFCGVNFCV